MDEKGAQSIKGTSESGSLFRSKVLKDAGHLAFGMPALHGKKLNELEKEPPKPSLEQRIAAIEKDAYQKGFAAGERAGLDVGTQKAAAILQRLQITLKELAELKDNLASDIEPGVLKLSVAIARKIIAKELAQTPESVCEIVKAALRKVEKTGPITIKINPALEGIFKTFKPELLNIHPEIVFDIDPSVSMTGPLVIGPVDEIVTEIDEQIKVIELELEAMRVAARA